MVSDIASGSGLPPSGVRSSVAAAEIPLGDGFVREVAAQLTLAHATELLSGALARTLQAPVALLSRDSFHWRFEAHAFAGAGHHVATKLDRAGRGDDALAQLQHDSGHAWTAVELGVLGDREWALLLPGESALWAARPGFEQLVENAGWSLGQVASREQADYGSRFQRRLYAFTRRLAREGDGARLHSLVLRTLASHVHARTGALALYDAAEEALTIVATLGYPRAIVEHLRIRPGEGLLGRRLRLGEGDRRRRRGRRNAAPSLSHRFVHGGPGAGGCAVAGGDCADRPF